jgi:hypothetical protein
MVYLISQGAIKSAVNNDAQEGKMNILVDTVHVAKKVPQLVGTMGPDDESVMVGGVMSCPVECHPLEVLHEEVGSNWRRC